MRCAKWYRAAGMAGVFAGFLGLAMATTTARADVISSTDDPYCEAICPGIFGPDVFRDQSVAIRFSPDRDYRLDSSAVWLWDNDNSSVDFVRITIREGGDSTPSGNILESITFAAPSTRPFQPQLVTINSVARPTLRRGVFYWLVLESDALGGESSVWAVANPGNGFASIGLSGRWQEGGFSAWGAHTILGTPLSSLCPADVDNGTGTGTPDGAVTIDDLLYYVGIYEAGAAAADLDDGSGTGTRDGGVTIEDLLYFVLRYERGC